MYRPSLRNLGLLTLRNLGLLRSTDN